MSSFPSHVIFKLSKQLLVFLCAFASVFLIRSEFNTCRCVVIITTFIINTVVIHNIRSQHQGISFSSIVAAASDKAASAASCLLLQLSSTSSSSSYWLRITIHATFNSCSSSGQTMRIEINHDVYITALCRHQPNDCAYTRLHNSISISSSSSSSSSSRGAAGAAAAAAAAAAGASSSSRGQQGQQEQQQQAEIRSNIYKPIEAWTRTTFLRQFENALYEIKMQNGGKMQN